MEINTSLALRRIFEMVNGFIAALPRLTLALLVLVLLYVISKWLYSIVDKLTDRSDLSKNAGLLLARVVRWAVLLMGALVALSIALPTFEPGQLIELLGIASVAIGFAFRDIFQNFLAGMLILFTEPFQVGDQIVVGDYEGTVEDIQTRATSIRTYDNRIVVIPNGEVFTNSVTVNTADDHRRSQYDVGIGYEDDINQAKALMLEAMDEAEGVLSEPAPDVLTRELGDSSVVIRARWWTKSARPSVMQVHDQVVSRIKTKLDANDINIPFPIRTVFFNDETENETGKKGKSAQDSSAQSGNGYRQQATPA